MLRIKQKDFALFLIVVMISGIGFLPISASMKMVILGIQLTIIVAKAKISFISIFSFLINFCMVQQYIAYIGGEVYGLLNVRRVPIYFDELFLCTCFFNLIIIFFALFTEIVSNEKILFSGDVRFGDNTTVIMLILALVLTFLIFPSIPSLDSFTLENRFTKGIIPFTGWAVIPYFFLAVAFTNKRFKKSVIICAVIIMFWYAFHGERAEAMGFMAYIAIAYYNQSPNKATIVKLGVLGGMLIILFIVIGLLRNGKSEINASDVIKSVFVQPTACDVTYVFNCAMDVLYKGKQFSGITYLSYLINCVPFLNDAYSFAIRIKDHIYTPGGGMFFCEPVANFGIGFSAFVSFCYIFFIHIITKRKNKYGYLLYTTICISIFRLAWYGLNYPIIAMLYFVPGVLFLENILKKRDR